MKGQRSPTVPTNQQTCGRRSKSQARAVVITGVGVTNVVDGDTTRGRTTRLRRKLAEGQATVVTKKVELDKTSVGLPAYEESHRRPVKHRHYTK
ncbi:hypothetical protein PC128_g22477 [Phytophthora cactorum]|nr:hypothetical protein PC120_g25007 [Phytophthora cactorum]KAG3153858.1 hypothetical protein PC128_g22477 [Phytophthora cactorum]KAG4038952.1 hypothetical protein PC123_g25490 [Phytophthora cactorum]